MICRSASTTRRRAGCCFPSSPSSGPMPVTKRAGRLLSHNLRGRQVTFASQPFTELGVALTRYREVAFADLDVGIFTGPEIRRRLLRQRALSGKISLGRRIDLSLLRS